MDKTAGAARVSKIEASSTGYQSPPIFEVESTVYVMPSPAIAARVVAAAAGRRARECHRRRLERNGRRAICGSEERHKERPGQCGSFFRRVTVEGLPSPLRVVPAYGQRTKECILAPCGDEAAERVEHELGFAVGATLVLLHDTGMLGMFPPATERRLLSLLYSRAKAHKL